MKEALGTVFINGVRKDNREGREDSSTAEIPSSQVLAGFHPIHVVDIKIVGVREIREDPRGLLLSSL